MDKITVKEALIQKFNFFVLSFLAILGISLSAEIFLEDDFADKIDDAGLLILGLIGIWWYRKNSTKKSLIPVIFTVIALALKIMAILIEHADKEAVGDDIGITTALIIGLIFIIYQYFKVKRLN